MLQTASNNVPEYDGFHRNLFLSAFLSPRRDADLSGLIHFLRYLLRSDLRAGIMHSEKCLLSANHPLNEQTCNSLPGSEALFVCTATIPYMHLHSEDISAAPKNERAELPLLLPSCACVSLPTFMFPHPQFLLLGMRSAVASWTLDDGCLGLSCISSLPTTTIPLLAGCQTASKRGGPHPSPVPPCHAMPVSQSFLFPPSLLPRPRSIYFLLSGAFSPIFILPALWMDLEKSAKTFSQQMRGC